jgi:hypothetical protein
MLIISRWEPAEFAVIAQPANITVPTVVMVVKGFLGGLFARIIITCADSASIV